jgi:hypothetical protein
VRCSRRAAQLGGLWPGGSSPVPAPDRGAATATSPPRRSGTCHPPGRWSRAPVGWPR